MPARLRCARSYYSGGRPGCGGNGKPVYMSQRVDEDVGVAPYLYSPARRNSWLDFFGGRPTVGFELDDFYVPEKQILQYKFQVTHRSLHNFSREFFLQSLL